jgi:biopolymer transport protein ExbD
MDFRGGSGRRKRRLEVELNVVSFIDIIFNLLVFFILSTSFTTGATSSGLVVDLPAAASADQKVRDRDLVIALTKEGLTVVRNRNVDVSELQPLLKEWQTDTLDAAGAGGFVIVQADAEVPHGRVVEVMDKVKAQGIARVVIAAQGN